MTVPLTAREAAEAIEKFGEDLLKLDNDLTRLCAHMSPQTLTLVEAIDHQDRLTGIAESFRELGAYLCRECDEADEVHSE